MVSTATVVVKATGATREVPTSAPIVLDAASTVRLQIDPDNVRTISRAGVEGRDLVIVLDDGTQIVVSNYFVADDAGTLSELVLEDATGAQWWLRDDPDTGGFMLVGSETIPVASALTASDGAAVVASGEGGPSALAIGLGVGALALGAAAAGGGGGGGSGGTTPTPPAPPPPDTTPPARPTAQISATGSTVSGTAEPASNVRVYDAGGNVIGSARADGSGNYTITLNPPRVAGEQLTVTATDAAGNESAPIGLTAPDLTDNDAPDAPTAVINAAGDAVSGTAEAGATVNVYDADGNVIGTGVAGADGRYTIALDPPLVAGEALTVTATDAAGNESAPVSLNAPDLTDTIPPDAPTAVINAAGDTVSGSAEVGATVNVYDADGNVIGTGIVGTDGRYTIALDSPLIAGEALTVTATDAAGNESDPVDLLAPDLTDNTAPEPPTAVISATGDTVTGTAEVGARVNVYAADGVVIGTGIAGTDGRYTITLDPAQTEGQALTATATDAAGNESAPIDLLAPDLTDDVAPEAPTAAIAPDGASITGLTEAGATVRVYSADGVEIGTGVAGTDGRYTIRLDPALVAGEVVEVTATDAANNESDPTQAIAPDLSDSTAPDSPTAAINAAGDTVTGTAEAGATVTVRDVDGNILGEDTAAADGSYSITLDPALTAGEQLSVVASDGDGNDSFPTTIFAPDLTDSTAPDAPTAAINDLGDTVTGRSEAGAIIEVRDADDTLLGTTTADASGFYSVTLVPAQTEGQALSVTAIDASDNASAPTTLLAPDLSDDTAPNAPTAAINDSGDIVTGLSEGGVRIEVRSADGALLGTAVAGTDGRYMVALDPPQINGESLLITAIDAANNTSPATPITAPDLTDNESPAAPTAAINDAGDTVTGQTEAGARVEVRDVAGEVLGDGVAGSDGRYTVMLTPPQIAGEQLVVVAIDAAGNASSPTPLTAPDLSDDEAPTPPTAEINAAGDAVSGIAEPGSTVTVTVVGGGVAGTAMVGTDGAYTVALAPPLTSGEQLAVTATDAAGNVSDATLLTAPVIVDDLPPAPPLATISGDGATVSGTAEAGSTVRVFDSSNVELGSTTAAGDGTFSITLTPPLRNGEALSVTATDAANNVSDPTLLVAPDAVAPLPPTAEISDDGVVVSGVAEGNSTVRVFGAGGALLGSMVAGADGIYSITLTTPQINGEQLAVTATDGANNESLPRSLLAPDLTDTTAPLPPNALVSADGDEVTGSAEIGSTVTIRDANSGTVLGYAVVGDDGTYAIPLSPPLINGERLSVVATDGAGNTSEPTVINAPNLSDSVIAYDDIATASLDLVPATQSVDHGSAGYLALVSVNLLNLQANVNLLGTPSVGFTVEAGHSLDAVFDYTALATLGVLGNYQVVVQRWDGTQWTGVGGTGQATLLELNLLLSGAARAEIPDLGPGEYRAFMTFNGVGVGVLGALSVGGVESDFTAIAEINGAAVTGNVMTDGGGDVVTANTAVLSVNGQTVNAVGDTVIVGNYGTLTITSTGAYSYTPNELGANIGQVDQFQYVLADSVTGVSDTAILYIRIGSPDVPLVWDDANPGVPATFDFAAGNDSAIAGVDFRNVVADLVTTNATAVLGLFTQPYVSQTFTVAGNMDMSGTATVSATVALLTSGALALQRQAGDGSWVNVDVHTYSSLLGVGAPLATIDLDTLDLDPGVYRFRASGGAVVGVGVNINIDVNATYLDQYQVSGVESATGNLLANDTIGSDFTQLQVYNSATLTWVTISGGDATTIQGLHGTLAVDASGNYVYTPFDNAGHFTQPVSDTFDYQLVHPTGETSDGALVVTVEPGGAGVQATVDSFDLEAMSVEDAVVDDASGAHHVSGLFEDMSSAEPMLVRGEDGQIIELLNSSGGGGFHSSPAWEIDYMVPLRHEDDTDTLLSHQSTSAL